MLVSLVLSSLSVHAQEDPTALLAVHLARDGLRLPAEELAARTDAGCAQGSRALCAMAEVPPGDRQAAYTALSAQCGAHDATSCLGAAWASLPLQGSSVDSRRPQRPAEYRSQLEEACAGGVARACTELGFVHEHGLATYPSRPRALQRWLEGCAQGEPHACTAAGHALQDDPRPFHRAQSLGDPGAHLDLARLEPDEAEAHLLQACQAGVTEACFESARSLALTDPARASEPLARSCALGDPPSCALALKLDALASVRPLEETVQQLQGLCPTVPEACEDLAFVGHGAPLTFLYPGHTPNTRKDLERGVNDLAAPLHGCTRSAAGRHHGAQGAFHASLRIETDGRVSAAYVGDALDVHHRTCLETTLMGGRFRAPQGGVQRAEVVVPGYHGTRVRLSAPPGVEVHNEVTAVATDAQQWAAPLDACYLQHAQPAPGVGMQVRFLATRAGALEQIELVESSDEPEVDACVLDWLRQRRVTTPPEMPMRMLADLEFVTPWPTDPRTSQGGLVRAVPEGPRPQTTVRVLVLAVQRGMVDGKRAKLGARSLSSIQEVHTDLASWVTEHTHGALKFEWELVTVPDLLEGSLLDDDGYSRWNVSPGDLSDEIVQLVASKRADSVFLYSPIPRGFPQPALGVAFRTQIAGATFASLALPSGREVQSNPGTPTFHLPLHEWWHQMEYRSEQLGVTVPQNHEILRLNGVALNPRDWLDSSNTMEWYDEVLGYQVHPELWAEAWKREPWNLVPYARHPPVLADGATSDGGFHLGHPLTQELALTWEHEVPIYRVRLHLLPRDTPTTLVLQSGAVKKRVVLEAGASSRDVEMGVREGQELQVSAGDEGSEEVLITEMGVYTW
jgi:TPR repeat protein